MSILPVANQINDHIFLKLFPVIIGKLETSGDTLRVISINMQNRRPDCLGQVRAIETGSGLIGNRSESNLVIDHNMDSASYVIRDQILHL